MINACHFGNTLEPVNDSLARVRAPFVAVFGATPGETTQVQSGQLINALFAWGSHAFDEEQKIMKHLWSPETRAFPDKGFTFCKVD